MDKTEPAVEMRCPRCQYPLEDPGSVRCPRCYSTLQAHSCCRGDCRNCGLHRHPGREDGQGRAKGV